MDFLTNWCCLVRARSLIELGDRFVRLLSGMRINERASSYFARCRSSLPAHPPIPGTLSRLQKAMVRGIECGAPAATFPGTPAKAGQPRQELNRSASGFRVPHWLHAIGLRHHGSNLQPLSPGGSRRQLFLPHLRLASAGVLGRGRQRAPGIAAALA